jgi:hypothetical protein
MCIRQKSGDRKLGRIKVRKTKEIALLDDDVCEVIGAK